MNWLMPITTTATEIQRNYKQVRNRAKKAKVPVTVLANNKPESIYMDYETFVREYIKRDKISPRKQKSDFSEFLGLWTKEEADEFDKIIEDAFEQVNPEDWRS